MMEMKKKFKVSENKKETKNIQGNERKKTRKKMVSKGRNGNEKNQNHISACRKLKC